jgi:N-acetylmuramoyl-L-alanine amidase
MPRRISFCLLIAFTLVFAVHSIGAEPEKGKSAKKTAASAKKQKKNPKKKSVKTAKAVPQKRAKVAPVEKPQALPAQLTDVRHWSTPDYTRVAVTLSHDAPFEKHEIAKAPGSGVLSRIFFDIHGAKLAPGARDLTIGDGLLNSVRVAQYKPDTVRVVLDVDNIRDYKIFTFSEPFRIIVDVKGEKPTEISVLSPAIAAPPPLSAPALKEHQPEPGREETAVKTPPRPRLKPGSIRRIVVDPGHGGKDPGAVGLSGLQEKDVVLSIGQKVAKMIREELGIDAVMTRSTDVFIELQERTAIANQVGADLFISIHANAALNRKANGIETYYLNLAKTEKAAQLAARENGTSLEKVSLLQAVLFDLMANYKLNDSAHLAEEVQKALFKRLSGHDPATKNLGVKQGPFYVLVGATMPSILIESAFISNPQEEMKLADPKYLEETAEGIIDGIVAYIAALK